MTTEEKQFDRFLSAIERYVDCIERKARFEQYRFYMVLGAVCFAILSLVCLKI